MSTAKSCVFDDVLCYGKVRYKGNRAAPPVRPQRNIAKIFAPYGGPDCALWTAQSFGCAAHKTTLLRLSESIQVWGVFSIERV